MDLKLRLAIIVAGTAAFVAIALGLALTWGFYVTEHATRVLLSAVLLGLGACLYIALRDAVLRISANNRRFP